MDTLNSSEHNIQETHRTANGLKAMAHPLRLAILTLLSEGPLSAGDIEKGVGSTQSNVSQHLSVLKKQGLISCSSAKNNRIYQVDNWRVFKLISMAESLFSNG